MLLAETGTNWEVIIAALGLVVVSLYREYLASQREQAKIKRDNEQADAIWEVKDAADEQHKVMNSRLDEFKKLKEEAERAKGNLEGRAEVKAETAIEVAAVVAAEREAKKEDVLIEKEGTLLEKIETSIGAPTDGTLSQDVANVHSEVAKVKAKIKPQPPKS